MLHCINVSIHRDPRLGRYGGKGVSWQEPAPTGSGSGGRFKNTYELLNLRALKYSPVNKIHIFQCMVFCDILCGISKVPPGGSSRKTNAGANYLCYTGPTRQSDRQQCFCMENASDHLIFQWLSWSDIQYKYKKTSHCTQMRLFCAIRIASDQLTQVVCLEWCYAYLGHISAIACPGRTFLVSWQLYCLFDTLFSLTSNEATTLRLAGNPLMSGRFPVRSNISSSYVPYTYYSST